MCRQLHHIKVFLRDEVAVHAEAKFVPSRGGEDQRRDINAEVRALEPVGDDDIRESGTTDKLLIVQINEVNGEFVAAFGIGQAEVQSHLLVLEGKAESLEMGKQSDQTLLLGYGVFDDLVTNQESLNARFGNIRHESYSTRLVTSVKGI